MTTEYPIKDIAIWTFISITSSIILHIVNKSIYSLFGCNYWMIHFIHYFITFAVFSLLTCCRIFKYERIPLSNILPLAISESLVSISISIMYYNGSEQDLALVRSADFAITLLIIFLANKLSIFRFSEDLRATSILIFIAICSAISWSTTFCFNKSLLFAWPLIVVASVARYFLAVKTSQQLNVSYEMLTMYISGLTCVFVFPFAAFIKSDKFLQDFDEGFGVDFETYHYTAILIMILCVTISIYSNYWLIFKVNTLAYFNTQYIKAAHVLFFKWLDENFIHTTPTNMLFLFLNIFGTFMLYLANMNSRLSLYHSPKDQPSIPTHKIKEIKEKPKFAWHKKILIGILTFLFILAFKLFLKGHPAKSASQSIASLNDDHIAEWEADDIRLIDHIRKFYLVPPTPRNVPYNLVNEGNRYWSAKSQSSFVENYFHGKKNGFFIECGAADGEYQSNTLSFEKYHNWTGLLIEPDYTNYELLKSKKRKSWIVNACLTDSTRPMKKILYGASQVGQFAEHMPWSKQILTGIWDTINRQSVWCFPLLSLLKAVNHTKVDYFVLDVEGPEIQILKSLHWSKIDITLLQIEYAVMASVYFDRDLSTKRKKELRSFMTETLPQYKELKLILYDIMFAKYNNSHSVK